jgi:hypothetical protein
MEVYLAQPRGFCAGVVRAIEIVERAFHDLDGAHDTGAKAAGLREIHFHRIAVTQIAPRSFFEASMRPDICNIRTSKFPRPIPWYQAHGGTGLCVKKTGAGKGGLRNGRSWNRWQVFRGIIVGIDRLILAGSSLFRRVGRAIPTRSTPLLFPCHFALVCGSNQNKH